MAGFEPTAFRSQSGRATKLRHTPSGATRRLHARRQRGCRISRAPARTVPRAPPPGCLEQPGRGIAKRPPPPRHGAHPTRTAHRSKRTRTASPGRPRGVAPRGRSDVGAALANGTGPARGSRVGVVVTPRKRRAAGRPAHAPARAAHDARGAHQRAGAASASASASADMDGADRGVPQPTAVAAVPRGRASAGSGPPVRGPGRGHSGRSTDTVPRHWCPGAAFPSPAARDPRDSAPARPGAPCRWPVRSAGRAEGVCDEG